MEYQAQKKRYDSMTYNRSGKSGVLLPAISLGLWHNFGAINDFVNARDILRAAFDQGVTHFDMANNYGPPYGSAEITLGKVLKSDFKAHRDELFISSKAGYDMWPGPYGDHGSRKYLMASLDQSLKRMGLEYVDVFYHHRPDKDTPLEESMQALSDIVRRGKALYVAVSNYPADMAIKAFNILKENNTPCLLHQCKYNMFLRWVEKDLLDALEEYGVGGIAFSPLAEGVLTRKYLKGIPRNSRAAQAHGHLKTDWLTADRMNKVSQLNDLALERGQTLAQMAVAWLLKDKRIASVLVGASSVKQLKENLKSLDNLFFTSEELQIIETILNNRQEYLMNL